MGKLFLNDMIIEKVKERLKHTHLKEDAAEAKELQRLQAEFRPKNEAPETVLPRPAG
jgi:hypothetical protein